MRIGFKLRVGDGDSLELVVGSTLKQYIPEEQERIAYEILDVAQQLCPIDTGSLRASGEVVDDEEQDEARPRKIVVFGNEDGYFGKPGGRPAGDPVDYAPHVEYGTAKSMAQPFLTPAAEAMYPVYVERMRTILDARGSSRR